MVAATPLMCGAACGLRHSAAVTETGEVWAWGTVHGLPHDSEEYRWSLEPRCVGGVELFGCRAVAVAAGASHTVAVTEDGSAWAWGEGDAGQLGLADMLPHTEPIKVNLDARVVMVSCGFGYTLVATIAGELFSWGYGSYGQLGHGDRKHRGTLTCVAGMHGIPVATVAAGELHATAVTAQGDVWTWGCGENGRLGHQDEDDRLAPQRLEPRSFEGNAVVQTAAGGAHTVAVSADGSLWAWGKAAEGRLGLGKDVRDDVLAPLQVGGLETFGGCGVVWASCGGKHTLAVCSDGSLFSWGRGAGGRLGQGDRNKRFKPACVRAGQLASSKVIVASAGDAHCMAVREDGSLFSWGRGIFESMGCESPTGLGHGGIDDILVPQMLALPKLVRTSRHMCLLREDALALAMSTHRRLGARSPCSALLDDLVKRIVEAGGGLLDF